MAERRKRNGTKNIDVRLDALRAELDAMRADMKGLAVLARAMGKTLQ